MIFGTKALGFLLFLLQSPSPAQGASTGTEFTITEMVKNIGAVAITVVIILLIMSVYAIAIKTAEFRRGLSGLATIGSTAPFVGLFGTVFGIINAFRGMKNAETAVIAAVAGGISEALFTTALGLVVAVPAVWLFNYFTG